VISIKPHFPCMIMEAICHFFYIGFSKAMNLNIRYKTMWILTSCCEIEVLIILIAQIHFDAVVN